jgi:hypothetical protein
MVVLWIVTGVFAAIFTEGVVEYFLDKKEITNRVVYYPVLVLSIAAIIVTLIMLFQDEYIGDPSEFTLLLSNGIVFISCFFGTATLSFIATKL